MAGFFLRDEVPIRGGPDSPIQDAAGLSVDLNLQFS